MSGILPPGLFRRSRMANWRWSYVPAIRDRVAGPSMFPGAEPAINEFGTIVFQDGNGGIYLADDQETIEVQELGESDSVQGTINALQISTSWLRAPASMTLVRSLTSRKLKTASSYCDLHQNCEFDLVVRGTTLRFGHWEFRPISCIL